MSYIDPDRSLELDRYTTPLHWRGNVVTESRSWAPSPSYDASSGKSKAEYMQGYWKDFENLDSPTLFGYDNVRVSSDGGLSDVPKLLSRRQYTKALITASLILFNISTVLSQDINILTQTHDKSDCSKFLVSKWIAYKLNAFHNIGDNGNFERLAPLLELVLLALICLSAAKRLILASYATENRDLKRWHSVAYTFWVALAMLRRFSALQQLYYVTPGVLKMEGSMALLHVRQRLAAPSSHRSKRFLILLPLISFAVTRIAAFVIGLDAFLVKFRLASEVANADWSRNDLKFRDFMDFVSFFFQVLGVVDLKRLIRERLFIFVFAGEDGSMDIDEEALAAVWRARITKRIYEYFGMCRGTVVMLGFDDYDFQMLALDDDEREIRQTLSAKGKSCGNLSLQILSGSLELSASVPASMQSQDVVVEHVA